MSSLDMRSTPTLPSAVQDDPLHCECSRNCSQKKDESHVRDILAQRSALCSSGTVGGAEWWLYGFCFFSGRVLEGRGLFRLQHPRAPTSSCLLPPKLSLTAPALPIRLPIASPSASGWTCFRVSNPKEALDPSFQSPDSGTSPDDCTVREEHEDLLRLDPLARYTVAVDCCRVIDTRLDHSTYRLTIGVDTKRICSCGSPHLQGWQ